jgi:hypothetical protein
MIQGNPEDPPSVRARNVGDVSVVYSISGTCGPIRWHYNYLIFTVRSRNSKIFLEPTNHHE